MVDRLAHDLQSALPSNRRLPARNLWRMRAFYPAYPASVVNLPQAVKEIPWGHNTAHIENVRELQQRLWYDAAQTVEHGWSLTVLVHQFDSASKLRSKAMLFLPDGRGAVFQFVRSAIFIAILIRVVLEAAVTAQASSFIRRLNEPIWAI